MNKRNPRLVPYNLLDEKTKKTNRDTVSAAVRTLIGYGYNIEPPDQESSKFSLLSKMYLSYFCSPTSIIIITTSSSKCLFLCLC